MINYPNALQPPPAGTRLPERFLALTQAKGSVVGTNGTDNGVTDGTNSTLSVSPVNASLSSPTTNGLLVDPNINASSIANSTSLPHVNVGQHVLNGDGDVDGSDIGLGKSALGSQTPENQGLNPGVIAAVAIGGLVAFAILIAMVVQTRKIHKKKSREKIDSVYLSDNSSSAQYHRDSNSLY